METACDSLVAIPCSVISLRILRNPIQANDTLHENGSQIMMNLTIDGLLMNESGIDGPTEGRRRLMRN